MRRLAIGFGFALAVFGLVTGASAQVGGPATAKGTITQRPRVTGNILTAVVGILSTTTEKPGAPLSAWTGTGFMVDRCHVLTAAHVVMTPWGPADDIKIGWGPRPATVPAPTGSYVDSLSANFSEVITARTLWYGGTTEFTESIAELGKHYVFSGAAMAWTGESLAGDWALLEISPCLPAGAPVYSLPQPPFAESNDPHFSGGANTLGYPKGAFATVTDTQCAVVFESVSGSLVECPIFGGNSGGPLVSSAKDTEARGIVSNSNSANAQLVRTNAPAAVLAYRLTATPQPGCITRMKHMLQGAADRAGQRISFAPFDDTPTREFLRQYLHLASLIARQNRDVASAIIPAVPDAQWCQAIFANFAGPSALAMEAGHAGAWRRPNQGSTGFIVSTSASGTTISAIGDGIWPYVKEDRYLGELTTIGGLEDAGGETKYTSWTIAFYPGKPPILVSVGHGGQHYAVFEQLERGAPPSKCRGDRALALYARDHATSDFDVRAAQRAVWTFNNSVQKLGCLGPLIALPPGTHDVSVLSPLEPQLASAVTTLGCNRVASAQVAANRLELACSNRIGGVLIAQGANGAYADCLLLAAGVFEKIYPGVRCTLPANAHPEAVLTVMSNDLSGRSQVPQCKFVKASVAGRTNEVIVYEGLCEDGTGRLVRQYAMTAGTQITRLACGTQGLPCRLRPD